MSRSLAVQTLAVRDLRNLERVDLEAGPRFNVIAGDNGQGKTNLLEAVYLASSSKSFRASRPVDMVRHGQAAGSVKATVREDLQSREQSVGLEAGKRHVRIDGKRPRSLLDYAVKTPAVVFHPGEMELSMGGGAERRKLLDRVSLYLGAPTLSLSADYTRALRERQRALETRGEQARDLAEWEELLVTYGLAIMQGRRRATDLLGVPAGVSFSQIAPSGVSLDVRYAPGAPEEARAYLAALNANRALDRRRGSARVGPHRDDVVLSILGRSVRGFASQGQHRAVVLALKSAEVDVVATARGVRPILLLDEVSSELDRSRTAALFAFLQRHQGQVFLTTTRPELVDTGSFDEPGGRVDFRVVAGVVARV